MSQESAFELFRSNDSLEEIELEDLVRPDSFQSEDWSVV